MWEFNRGVQDHAVAGTQSQTAPNAQNFHVKIDTGRHTGKFTKNPFLATPRMMLRSFML